LNGILGSNLGGAGLKYDLEFLLIERVN